MHRLLNSTWCKQAKEGSKFACRPVALASVLVSSPFVYFLPLVQLHLSVGQQRLASIVTRLLKAQALRNLQTDHVQFLNKEAC